MVRVGSLVLGSMFWVSAVSSAPRPSTDASERHIEGTTHEAEQFAVELKADGPYRAGQEGTFVVTLTSKAGYKVNPQFPTRWKAEPADDTVKYPKPVLKKEDGVFTEGVGTFTVPFVPSKTGSVTLKGTLSLSVCSEKTCVMEKVTLDRAVDVR